MATSILVQMASLKKIKDIFKFDKLFVLFVLNKLDGVYVEFLKDSELLFKNYLKFHHFI